MSKSNEKSTADELAMDQQRVHDLILSAAVGAAGTAHDCLRDVLAGLVEEEDVVVQSAHSLLLLAINQLEVLMAAEGEALDEEGRGSTASPDTQEAPGE